MASRHVKTMAFGAVGGAAKLYVFAAPQGGGLLLLELVVQKESGMAAATVKAGGGAEAAVPAFSALLREMLSS
jgi:hypothetical protein